MYSFLNSEYLKNLNELWLNESNLTSKDMRYLSESDCLKNLVKLRLDKSKVSDLGIISLATASNMPRL